jgi:hypothetical protein
MGHATAELTLNLYGHYMGTDADRSGIAPLNSALAKAGTVKGPSSEDGRIMRESDGSAKPSDQGEGRELEIGIEPMTYALRECSPSSLIVPNYGESWRFGSSAARPAPTPGTTTDS